MKKQAENVRDSASNMADTATTAVRKTAGSFEKAARDLISRPAMIALGIGWLRRTRHPL